MLSFRCCYSVQILLLVFYSCVQTLLYSVQMFCKSTECFIAVIFYVLLTVKCYYCICMYFLCYFLSFIILFQVVCILCCFYCFKLCRGFFFAYSYVVRNNSNFLLICICMYIHKNQVNILN